MIAYAKSCSGHVGWLSRPSSRPHKMPQENDCANVVYGLLRSQGEECASTGIMPHAIADDCDVIV